MTVRRRDAPFALAAALLLAGCAGVTTAAPGTPLVTAVAAPTDPLAAFAAGAQPGAASQIVLAGGQPARVRLHRAYFAASGRECREVLVGTGLEERATILCQDPVLGWSVSRPLLRGSAPRSTLPAL